LLAQMSERFGPDQVKEYAGLIHAGGRNLLRLINQILDLTKIAGGKFELQRKRLDASGAMWLAREAFAERAEAKGVKLDAEDCPTGLLVDADEAAFEQMIHQLVDNAIAFTPAGGTVRLGAECVNRRVNLKVVDNGPGVEAEDLERILEPFEHAGRGGADHTGGAGLGLTLVKAFAELHGGCLRLASEPGRGFAATIELPEAG
jgi:cell cycle sensor histidine kinase DivJ